MKDKKRRQPPQQADLVLSDEPFLDLPMGEEEPPASLGGPGEAPSQLRSPAGGATLPSPTIAAPSEDEGELQMRPPELRPMVAVAKSAAGGGVARRWLWLVLALALPLGALAGYFLRGDPPLVVLDPEILDFGEVRVGVAGEPLALAIRNTGERSLEIESVLLQGDMAEEVSALEDTCSGAVVLAGQECRAQLRFAPAAGGPRKGELRIFSNAATSPDTVPLIALAVAPRLRFEPEEHDFGNQTVGMPSRPAPIYLANEGSAPVTIKIVNPQGRASADFVADQDTCTEQTLGPGERCAIRFTFVPTAEGERKATLRVISDALDDATDGMAGTFLFGTGLPQEPLLGLEPARLDFEPRLVGDAGPAQRVTLTNEGTGPLTVQRLEIEGREAGFRVSGTCKTLQPRQKCTVSVRFQPVREGAARGFLEIHHDAGDGLHRVALVGTGTQPRLEIEPQRLTFGEVQVRVQGEPRTLSLANTGSGPMQVRDLRLAGVDARSYSVRSETCAGRTLEPGDDCAVTLGFSPLRDGPHRAELVLRHSIDPGMSRLPLTGVGISAQLSLDASRLDFGEVRTGKSSSLRLELRNTGRAALRVRRVSVTGNFARAFELQDNRCSGARLAPGERCTLAVRFAPSEVGGRTAALEIDHDAADGPRQVALSAKGTPPPQPDIRVEPLRLEFGSLEVGRSSTLKVRLRNPGNGALTLRGLRLTGTQAADFKIERDDCGGSVAAGGQCTVSVRFAPAAAGDREAVLLVEHNAPGGTHSAELHGLAIEPPPPPEPSPGT